MEKVIVVVGPTGVGKTRMGVALAKHFNGEVISGDSMQIYKTMDIGTAKVTDDEMEGIVHHLIDVKEPTESYSVKDFQDEVRLKIKEIISRGKLPIIVGGTGLYIKAALYDYEFSESQTNHQEYVEKYQDYSNEELYNYLIEIDKASAKELHPNNRQRVLRAIAIYESTGIKKLIQLFVYLREMVKGGIVFIDEFDSNLHDVYLCALLEYLGEGQLCFTTHNVGPMDILKQYNKSIDFLSEDHKIYPWTKRGNYSPSKLYRNGMIEGNPFNIDSIDFIGVFGFDEEDE